MYCPQCGTKLPELEWKHGLGGDYQSLVDTECPNPDCKAVIQIVDEREWSQEGKIAVTLW